MTPDTEKMLKNCRLCQQIPGCIQLAGNDKFIEQVYECTRIKINDDQMHVLPKTVCRFCKVRIERFFTYVEEIVMVDQQLRDKFAVQLDTKFKVIVPSIDTELKLLENYGELEEKSPCFKCPVCPQIFRFDQNLQFHIQDHENLYCRNCAQVFENVVLYKRHVCDNTESSQHCEINLQTQVEGYNIIQKRINSTEMMIEETALKMEISNEDNEKPEATLLLSDIIRNTTGLAEENIEIQLAVSDEELEGTENDNIKYLIVDAVSDEKPEKILNDELEGCSDDNEVYEEEIITKRKPDGYLSCNLCDQKYKRTSHLRKHQKTHTGSFPCSFKGCYRICPSAYSLEMHSLKHKGKLPFLCSTCGKGLTTKSSLKCHEKIHAKTKEYICQECNISFSIRNTLKAHQKREHEGVRFYCSQCPQAFTARGSLERHELVHKGVRNCECEFCGMKFYTSKELLSHQKYHKDTRSYKCDECFKTFFEKHHLKIHMRFHTGERPYVCQHIGCDKSFVDSKSLAQHKKSRHFEK